MTRRAISVDPRRYHHTVGITERGVAYGVQSRFPVIISPADEDVFKAEAMSFLAKLSGASPHLDELPLALARQRAVDKTFMIRLVLLSLLLSIILGELLYRLTR